MPALDPSADCRLRTDSFGIDALRIEVDRGERVAGRRERHPLVEIGLDVLARGRTSRLGLGAVGIVVVGVVRVDARRTGWRC